MGISFVGPGIGSVWEERLMAERIRAPNSSSGVLLSRVWVWFKKYCLTIFKQE